MKRCQEDGESFVFLVLKHFLLENNTIIKIKETDHSSNMYKNTQRIRMYKT